PKGRGLSLFVKLSDTFMMFISLIVQLEYGLYYMSDAKEFSIVNGRFVSKHPVLVIGREKPMTYATEAIIRLNQGAEKLIIVGRGRNISKTATVYNIIKSRLRDVVDTEDISIGSIEGSNRRLISYLAIVLSRKV
ncbi:MAG: hypothetical protein ABWJ42_02860, partial [Sulfolobales archaeon]